MRANLEWSFWASQRERLNEKCDEIFLEISQLEIEGKIDVRFESFLILASGIRFELFCSQIKPKTHFNSEKLKKWFQN